MAWSKKCRNFSGSSFATQETRMSSWLSLKAVLITSKQTGMIAFK